MTRTDSLVSIPDTEKQFSDEWLAFEVVTLDDQGFPLRGRLLANSPDRDAVWEVVLQVRPEGTYVVWTGERPPQGMGYVL